LWRSRNRLDGASRRVSATRRSSSPRFGVHQPGQFIPSAGRPGYSARAGPPFPLLPTVRHTSTPGNILTSPRCAYFTAQRRDPTPRAAARGVCLGAGRVGVLWCSGGVGAGHGGGEGSVSRLVVPVYWGGLTDPPIRLAAGGRCGRRRPAGGSRTSSLGVPALPRHQRSREGCATGPQPTYFQIAQLVASYGAEILLSHRWPSSGYSGCRSRPDSVRRARRYRAGHDRHAK
jgi:hypothetical protein